MSLPREMITQRHPTASVSAPGVRLWNSETQYLPLWRGDTDITDFVTNGEVELAQMDTLFLGGEWDVETNANDLYDVAGNVRTGLGDDWDNHLDYPGVYQNLEFGTGDFGEGPFGGIETVWYREHGPIQWKLEGS